MSRSIVTRTKGAFSRFGAALLAVGGTALVAPGLALAQADVEFDPAPVLAIVTEASAFIIAVGLAVLTLLMVAKGIRWARKAG